MGNVYLNSQVVVSVYDKIASAVVFTLENLETFLKVSTVIVSFDKYKSVRRC